MPFPNLRQFAQNWFSLGGQSSVNLRYGACRRFRVPAGVPRPTLVVPVACYRDNKKGHYFCYHQLVKEKDKARRAWCALVRDENRQQLIVLRYARGTTSGRHSNAWIEGRGKRKLRVYVVRQHKGEQNTNATNPLWGIRLKTETTAKEQGNNDIWWCVEKKTK
jgi:hypothetical protein